MKTISGQTPNVETGRESDFLRFHKLPLSELPFEAAACEEMRLALQLEPLVVCCIVCCAAARGTPQRCSAAEQYPQHPDYLRVPALYRHSPGQAYTLLTDTLASTDPASAAPALYALAVGWEALGFEIAFATFFLPTLLMEPTEVPAV